jgi:hypothetical protein
MALLITPKTRVGELLDAYPELEPVLMDLAPAFKKLQNPVLRRTVGKVATLQQAATIGNVPLSVIINTLRAEIGQALYDGSDMAAEINEKEPGWYRKENVRIQFDATPLINAGENPMQEILKIMESIGQEDLFLLITPFLPAPIIELVGKKGFDHYCQQLEQDVFHTYFIRNH